MSPHTIHHEKTECEMCGADRSAAARKMATRPCVRSAKSTGSKEACACPASRREKSSSELTSL